MSVAHLADEDLKLLCGRIQECIAPFAGRIEYGNLRMKVDAWHPGQDGTITNVALVYETPGGSTDQINTTFHQTTRQYSLIDIECDCGEFTTGSLDELMGRIRVRVAAIPEKRIEHLRGEIRRQLDSGMTTAGVVGHLNRMMNSGLRGGTMTHLEMRDAMSYAVKYLKDRNFPGSDSNGVHGREGSIPPRSNGMEAESQPGADSEPDADPPST